MNNFFIQVKKLLNLVMEKEELESIRILSKEEYCRLQKLKKR